MIKNIRVYPVFNSKGKDTLKVKLYTDSGVYSASVPSGTSKGKYEAVELPVEKILRFFSAIRPHLIKRDEKQLDVIDALLRKLDSTGTFSRIGENLALAISVACARAATGNELWKLTGERLSVRFPIPLGNVIGGGRHAGGTDWQEFLLIPYKAENPHGATQTLLDAWSHIGDELRRRKLLLGRNIENAWMARMDEEKTLEFLSGIAEDWDLRIGIDAAASSLWDGKSYVYERGKKKLNPEKQKEFVLDITERFRIYYLEDPLHEEDFSGFSELTKKLRARTLVVGDDLFCTNPKRIRIGARKSSANGIIIKPNQIGTLTEATDAVSLARKSGMAIIPSHRSGESFDDWLADLCLAWDSPLFKSGITGADAPKLNRLIELWEEIPGAEMAELPLR